MSKFLEQFRKDKLPIGSRNHFDLGTIARGEDFVEVRNADEALRKIQRGGSVPFPDLTAQVAPENQLDSPTAGVSPVEAGLRESSVTLSSAKKLNPTS